MIYMCGLHASLPDHAPLDCCCVAPPDRLSRATMGFGGSTDAGCHGTALTNREYQAMLVLPCCVVHVCSEGLSLTAESSPSRRSQALGTLTRRLSMPRISSMRRCCFRLTPEESAKT